MGQGRTRELSEQQVETLAKVQAKKNQRLKKRRARNAQLREDGVKFGKRDACRKQGKLDELLVV